MNKSKIAPFRFQLCSLFLFLFLSGNKGQCQTAPKLIAECTITYSVFMEGNNNHSTTKTLFIKGKKTRTDISFSTFHQSIIFDNKTGDAVVLKSVGQNHYISFFNQKQWKEKNSNWDDVKVLFTGETKTIAGFVCNKAILTTKDDKQFVVFYTKDFTGSATENPYQFNSIPGLILEYESQTGEGKWIAFKATNVDFSPVPASKFEIPTTGYRLL